MQGTRFDGRRLINFIIIPVVIFALLLLIDQLTKNYFRNEKSNQVVEVINNFLYFDFVLNTGSAFSFLANVDWAQTFFKILTPISLVLFIGFFIYAYKKGYKWLLFAVTLVIAGTIGNYIDRLIFSAVTDFISFKFGSYYFPTFNFADVYLCVGVVMFIIHLLFLDENALFRNEKRDNSSTEQSTKPED